MKQLLIFLMVILFSLCACGQGHNHTAPSAPENPEDSAGTETVMDAADSIPAAYAELLARYAEAINGQWGGEDLSNNGMSIMLWNCYGGMPLENIGYLVDDLDGDGRQELAIGVTEVFIDEFYSKLVFDLYTLAPDGSAQQLFSSIERDRYYYAGGSRFAHTGSSGAAESFEGTATLSDGSLAEIEQPIDPNGYVQMALTPMSRWGLT